MLLGRGAGGGPTSSAVLGDLIDAAKNLHSGARGATIGALERRPDPPDRRDVVAVLRVARRRRPPGCARRRSPGVFGKHEVSIQSMQQKGQGDDARLIFVTHLAREADGRGDDPRGARSRRGQAGRIRAARRRRRGMTELAHAGWPGHHRGVPRPAARSPTARRSSRSTRATRRCVDAPRLSEQVGARVLLKVEGANPTGSFKDRGMTVAISKAAEDGAKVVVCASTGNTSASAAAYAARAGMIAAVIIPDGHVALGKLAQALIHGAKVVPVRGSFDDALRHRAPARRARRRHGRQLDQPVPHRGPEDRGVRDLRRARRRARRALHPGRQRRQHHRVLEGLLASTRRDGLHHEVAADARLAGRGLGAARARRAGAAPRDDRDRDPHRQPGELGRRDRGPRRVRRCDRCGHRRPDPRRVPAAGLARRACSSSRRRRRRSPGCSRPRLKVCWSATRSWCAPLPATGSRTRIARSPRSSRSPRSTRTSSRCSRSSACERETTRAAHSAAR